MNLTDAALPCIVCGKVLTSACGGPMNQPNDGTCFEARGHYGSLFDMQDAGVLQVSVCSQCLRVKCAAGVVAQVVTVPREPIVIVEPFDPGAP